MKNILNDVQNVLLMGAGPTGVAPSTYEALSRPILGHLDPTFVSVMEGIKANLRTVMHTKNEITVPISGTGSAGMETAFVNMVQPGDKVLVLENGVFGNRMADVAGRLGAEVDKVEWTWGTPVVPADVKELLEKKQYDIVAIVHAETSTGVCNPVAEIGELVKPTGAYYLVDTVTSLGGIPVKVDEWNIDVCYSGSQKCLSCPPGVAPITFSDRAMDRIRNRPAKVPNWYLDMNLLTSYWGAGARTYHHTAPINMMYALYQALYNIIEEGEEAVFARHQAAHEALAAGLEKIGMNLLVDAAYRLPQLNAITVPEGVNEAQLRADLLKKHSIEISAGLGPLAGKIVRVGLMGYNATVENAERVVAAIRDCL